jgi:hypothetical protein
VIILAGAADEQVRNVRWAMSIVRFVAVVDLPAGAGAVALANPEQSEKNLS